MSPRLILIYATVAKTSLRNHNVSLVAASPTRHPGPLSLCKKKKEKKNRKEYSPHLYMKPHLYIFPGKKAGGFRDSSPSTSLAEGPVSQLRVGLCLSLASCCQDDWSWKSHAGCFSARVNPLRLYPEQPHNSGSINITWCYFSDCFKWRL